MRAVLLFSSVGSVCLSSLSGLVCLSCCPDFAPLLPTKTHFLVYEPVQIYLLFVRNPGEQVSTLLNKTAIDIVKAGQLEIFTPSYFFAARKK